MMAAKLTAGATALALALLMTRKTKGERVPSQEAEG
jgi:hypothetical protein